MILVRSPLRITLGGGGTDLPSYSNRWGGFCLVASIDKFVYVAITRPFFPGIYLKYSQLEKVDRSCDIQHPIFREALVGESQIEVTTLADVPSGTGLGSSSSFTTALLQAMAVWDHERFAPMDLAAAACRLEIEKLQQPIGKQDQYAAAVGGLAALRFHCDGRVTVTKPVLSHQARTHLEDHLLLFFTGTAPRVTADLLRDQETRTVAGDESMLRNLSVTQSIGEQTLAALEREDYVLFADCLNRQWGQKFTRSPGLIPESIAALHYDVTRKVDGGALGGKLVGAGGGGFLLFYADNPAMLRARMKHEGLDELRFKFDYDGTKVLVDA